MHAFLRSPIVVALSMVVIGCSQAASSGAPSVSPAPSTTGSGAHGHATGATDILLRYDEGGGFVPIEFFAHHLPIFTLYGDGTVIVQDPMADPLRLVEGVTLNRSLRAAHLSEDQIRSMLQMALIEGGLGSARADYGNDRVADASTATFTLNTGDLEKTVSVYALGLDVPGSRDVQARAGFKRLAGRLGAFGRDGTIATDAYVPARYRGVLMDGAGAAVAKPRPWPWRDLKPTDFVVPADRSAYGLPSRVLTIAQAEALGFESYQGGFQGVTLAGPGDGQVYSFTLRPLLPDEERLTGATPSTRAAPPDTPKPVTQPTAGPSPIQSAQSRYAPIGGLTLSDGGRHLGVAFVGGKAFAADDPCSIAYAATTRVVKGVLEVGVYDSRRPAGPAPVCDAMGYERHLEIDLAEPFAGTSWRDLFDDAVHAF